MCALARVVSKNLRLVDLSGCRGISARSMKDILEYISQPTCPGLKKIDITVCCTEAVLMAVATRARIVYDVNSELDLQTLVKSLQEGAMRHQFRHICNVLGVIPPLLVVDPEFAPNRNELFRSIERGLLFNVVLLLTVSFIFGDETRTYDVDDANSDGNSPLILVCGAKSIELAKMLVAVRANVSAANDRGETPLLAACDAGSLELAELLLRANANVSFANDRVSQIVEVTRLCWQRFRLGTLDLRRYSLLWGRMWTRKGKTVQVYSPWQ
jgi:hypothetical protein